MGRSRRSSILAAVATGALVFAGCSSGSVPSSFPSGGGSEAGVTDGSMESGNFGGSSSGGGTFMCGASMCTRYDWCLFIVSDAGAEMSATCVPFGNCQACNCLTQMVSAGQCAGDTVTCTSQPPLIVSCVPGGSSSGGPADSGATD